MIMIKAKVGMKVFCNGFQGTITKVHTWADNEMVDVKLESGGVCVAVSELKENNSTNY